MIPKPAMVIILLVSHFVVERLADGKEFEPSDNITAKENANSAKHYHYTNNRSLPGENYYSLKTIDNNSKYGYSVLPEIYQEWSNP